jgi:opacity protein-like surface antigen
MRGSESAPLQEAVMRRLSVVLGLLVWSLPALAGGEFEIPTLRGSEPFVPVVPAAPKPRWSGLYAGGQIGYNNVAVDGANATQPLVADMLRVLALESEQHVSQWTVLGKGETRSISYGGFLGYNVGWEGVILGIEASWYKLGGTVNLAGNSLSRVVAAGCCTYAVTLSGDAMFAVNSYGTIKARAGWEVGNFLPYGSIGWAVGQVSYNKTASAVGTQTDSNNVVTPFSFSESENKTGAWAQGVSLGAGVDFMVLPNVFVRAEYEYVAFLSIANFKPTVQSARAGVGFKF